MKLIGYVCLAITLWSLIYSVLLFLDVNDARVRTWFTRLRARRGYVPTQ